MKFKVKNNNKKYYQYGDTISNKIDDSQSKSYPKYQYKHKVHTEYYFPKNSDLYNDDHYFDTFGNLVVKKAKVMWLIYYKRYSYGHKGLDTP